MAWFKFGEPIKICQTAKLKSPPNKPRIRYIITLHEDSTNTMQALESLFELGTYDRVALVHAATTYIIIV